MGALTSKHLLVLILGRLLAAVMVAANSAMANKWPGDDDMYGVYKEARNFVEAYERERDGQ